MNVLSRQLLSQTTHTDKECLRCTRKLFTHVLNDMPVRVRLRVCARMRSMQTFAF